MKGYLMVFLGIITMLAGFNFFGAWLPAPTYGQSMMLLGTGFFVAMVGYFLLPDGALCPYDYHRAEGQQRKSLTGEQWAAWQADRVIDVSAARPKRQNRQKRERGVVSTEYIIPEPEAAPSSAYTRPEPEPEPSWAYAELRPVDAEAPQIAQPVQRREPPEYVSRVIRNRGMSAHDAQREGDIDQMIDRVQREHDSRAVIGEARAIIHQSQQELKGAAWLARQARERAGK